MFNVGGGELLVIFLVALIVLGPAKLPEVARQVGGVMREIRRVSSGFQDEMRAAMDDPVEAAARERGNRVVATSESPAPAADPGDELDDEDDLDRRDDELDDEDDLDDRDDELDDEDDLDDRDDELDDEDDLDHPDDEFDDEDDLDDRDDELDEDPEGFDAPGSSDSSGDEEADTGAPPAPMSTAAAAGMYDVVPTPPVSDQVDEAPEDEAVAGVGASGEGEDVGSQEETTDER